MLELGRMWENPGPSPFVQLLSRPGRMSENLLGKCRVHGLLGEILCSGARCAQRATATCGCEHN